MYMCNVRTKQQNVQDVKKLCRHSLDVGKQGRDENTQEDYPTTEGGKKDTKTTLHLLQCHTTDAG